MNKVIIVDSCDVCPYMAFFKKTKAYICIVLNKDITTSIDKKEIDSECKLEDAIIEKRHFDKAELIVSEGVAICKAIPAEDSFNYYKIGENKNFSRQVNGDIKVYHTGYEGQKYTLFPLAVFEKYFDIYKEHSCNIDQQQICPDCRRPIKWCECL